MTKPWDQLEARNDRYKAQLDAFLIAWALQHPERCGRYSPFYWLSGALEPKPGAYRIPLYRMRAMPPPFKSYKEPET